VTGYGLESQDSTAAVECFLYNNIQTDSEAHQAFYTMGMLLQGKAVAV
jgi:hypothetical protein